MSRLHTMLFCSACAFAAQSAVAHPFHVSTAEVEYNAATERFEVAMRLRIADLEDAISSIQGSRFRIVEGADSAKPVMDYLKKHFVISQRPHGECGLSWIGYELELHDVWIYFEAKPHSRNTTRMSSPRSPNIGTPSHKVERWEELFLPATAKPTASMQPNASHKLTIRNTALMEIQPQQVNMMAVRIGNRRKSAIHTLEKPQHELLFGEDAAR